MQEERQVQIPPTTWARTLARTPHVGPLLVAGYRARIACDHLLREARLVWRWWRDSREVTNFTYDLTPRNLEQLAAFLAQVTNVELTRVEALGLHPWAGELRDRYVRIRADDVSGRRIDPPV